MLPVLSAARPCGPESGVLTENSRIAPVFGSRRPSLFASWPVYQSAPSGAASGSWGRDSGVGTSPSRITTLTFEAAVSAAAATETRRNGIFFMVLLLDLAQKTCPKKGQRGRNSGNRKP